MPSFRKILNAGQVRAIQAYIFSRAHESAKPSENQVSDDKREPPYIRREGDILTARPRLKFEIDYLKAIAAYASTVPGTP